jgi:RNA polymerase sigma-70 factor (ECF subfamily)
MPSDAERVAASAEKRQFFLPLFLRNQQRLYAYIFTLLPNRADADDALQEASLAMWDKFDEQAPPNDFLSWARRIAYYKVLDVYKRGQRSRVTFSQTMLEHVAETAAEHAETLQLDERREALAGCVEKLGRRERDLLAERFADGATTRSTSVRVGRSVESVYKALSRLRQSLMDCVQRTLVQEARA